MRELYIKQKVLKITDHYPITDADQNPVYQVDEEFRFIKKKLHVSRPNGEKIFEIEKQISFLRPRFVVTFADGKQLEIRSKLTLFKKEIDIDPDELQLTLKGDFWDHSFSLYRGGQEIGKIQKKWLSWGDNYQLSIAAPEYEILFVAVVLAVDMILDDEQAAAAASSSN